MSEQRREDHEQTAERIMRQRTQRRYQAEVNQVRHEPIPASRHEQPRPAAVPQNEPQDGEDGDGGAGPEPGDGG